MNTLLRGKPGPTLKLWRCEVVSRQVQPSSDLDRPSVLLSQQGRAFLYKKDIGSLMELTYTL